MTAAVLRLTSPANGRAMAAQAHPSMLVHNQLLGCGPVIEVTSNQLLAPCDARITLVSGSGDVIQLSNAHGMLITLILGAGEQFSHHPALQKLVKAQQDVQQGQPLLRLNQALLRASEPTQRYLAVLVQHDSNDDLIWPTQGIIQTEQMLFSER